MNSFLLDSKIAATHLRKLTYDGAVRKYGFPLPSEIIERIDFELEVIREKYNPNIFLILHDLVETMTKRGIMFGPGRGKMPSSVVAYCLGITSIDPLQQHFIFELFLSPDRISLPYLYLDVEDEYEAISYLKDKYGFSPEYFKDSGLFNLTIVKLYTLSLIHNCLKLIKERRNEDININNIPLNDEATYRLLNRGDTVGIFHLEDNDAKYWLSQLNSICFNDLTAIIGLYNVGSRDDLANYCLRKNNNAHIKYLIPELEEYLHYTYGVTIYLEQIILISLKLAGFSRSEADVLQYAISRKEKERVEMFKEQFISRGSANGYSEESLRLIWESWETFRIHVNESHAASRALISYQTAWLKCHYPVEFYMTLIENPYSQDEVGTIMEDCKAHGIEMNK